MTTDVPPGLQGNPIPFAEGGREHNWLPFEQRRFYTNAFVISDDKLLLGYKKRGFGVDMYNGFGGKVEPGETPAQAAARELKEESGIDAPLEHAGTLLFLAVGSEWAFHIEVYSARSYTGTPTETDEMRPEWFSLSEASVKGVPSPPSESSSSSTNLPPIPYSEMWADDIYWLPYLVRGQKFAGRADFTTGEEGKGYVMKRYWFGTV